MKNNQALQIIGGLAGLGILGVVITRLFKLDEGETNTITMYVHVVLWCDHCTYATDNSAPAIG